MKFQVANFKLGQIYPSKKFGRACCERFDSLIICEGVLNVLNLDKFSTSTEFTQLYVDLSNAQSLNLLITTLKNMDADKNIFKSIKGIRLSNNNIANLQPLIALTRMELEMIDLRGNNVSELLEVSVEKSETLGSRLSHSWLN